VKYIALVICGLVSFACADPSMGTTFERGESAEQTPVPEETTGTVRQKAQFADDTVLNILGHVGAPTPQLLLTADNDPVNVNIYYIGDKTNSSGVRTPMAPVLISTVSLAADQTKVHTINTAHAAFSANHGCIVAQSIDELGADTFQTHVQFGMDTWSVGGSVFTGGSYRIPYNNGIVRMVLALTNQGDFSFNVTVNNVNGLQQTTVNLAPLSTWKFDTQESWGNLSGVGSVQVTTSNGGVLAVSGYSTIGTTAKYRYYPVKAAPYP
jgi:hypothetical protein